MVKNAFKKCRRAPLFKAYRGDLLVRKATIYRCYNFKGISEKEVHVY